MSPETRKTLLDAITEYGHSLTRIEGEKDQCKAIAAKVQADLDIDARHFVKLATAFHKDTTKAEHESAGNLVELFDAVRGTEA